MENAPADDNLFRADTVVQLEQTPVVVRVDGDVSPRQNIRDTKAAPDLQFQASAAVHDYTGATLTSISPVSVLRRPKRVPKTRSCASGRRRW